MIIEKTFLTYSYNKYGELVETSQPQKIHVEVEIVAVNPSKTKTDRGIVSYVTQTKNQHGDVLLISTTKIVVFKRA